MLLELLPKPGIRLGLLMLPSFFRLSFLLKNFMVPMTVVAIPCQARGEGVEVRERVRERGGVLWN